MEIIVDLHGTDETEQDARDKTIKKPNCSWKNPGDYEGSDAPGITLGNGYLRV
ncbi:hypothetical protein ACPCHW_02595 [Pseudomonas siliginis]|uniref:hypothetical protein n=1 Tax=Pseudomonas siliginis TaxID=2842346 RepID=UPI003C303A58